MLIAHKGVKIEDIRNLLGRWMIVWVKINFCALLDQDTGSIVWFVHSLAWFFNCKTNEGSH